MIKVKARMVAKEATAAEWTQSNPTLLAGEFGYETDTHKLKIGQSGVAWNSLPYFYGGATLPSVTSADNGSILVVNNGDWDTSSAPVFQILETQGYPQDPIDGYIYYDSSYGVYYACAGGNLQVILTEAMMDMDPSDPPTARLPKMGVAGEVYRLGDLFIDSDSGGAAAIDWADPGSGVFFWLDRFLCVRDPLGQYLYTICGDQTNLWAATAPDNTWTTLPGITLDEDVQSIQQWGDQLFVVTPDAVYTATVANTAASLEWYTYDLPLHQAGGTWTYMCYCFNKYFLIGTGTAHNVLVSESLSDPTWDDVPDLVNATKLSMPLFTSNTLMIPSEDECYDTTDGTVWYDDSYGYNDFGYFSVLGDYFIAIHTDLQGTRIMRSNNAYQWDTISTGIPNLAFPNTVATDGSQIIIAGNVGRFNETGYSITTDFQNFTWCPNAEFGQEAYMFYATGSYWYVLSYSGIGLMSLEAAGGVLTNGSGANVTDQMKKIILPDPGTVGQVMTNVGGKWQAANPANGQLPIVTTADAGKFLQVNDQGQWAAVYIPEGNGEYF